MQDVSSESHRATRSDSSAATAPARPPSPRSSPGEGLPAAGSVHASGSVGYLPQDPRTGDPEVLARERILSARGLDDVVRRLRQAEAEMGSDKASACASARCDATSGPTPICTPAAATRPSPRRLRSPPSLGIEERVLDQPLRDALRRSAAPRRAGPHPVLGRRDAAARRADQPPRRRLDHLAARVPQGSQGRAGGDQPRHRVARDDGQQGAPPRRQPRRDRRLQHGLDGLPRPARDRRAAPQARAPQRRAQGRRADGPGQQDAGQGDQGAGRAVDDEARGAVDGGGRRRAPRPTGSPASSSPRRRRAARRR